MWWIDRVFPQGRLAVPPWTHLGWVIMAAGFGIDAYSALAFFRAATTVNPMKVTRTRVLVTTGLYRWSRNPMYLGLVIALLGWAVTLGSIASPVVIVAFARILVILQIEPEEAALEAAFGNAYRDYRRRVRRWI